MRTRLTLLVAALCMLPVGCASKQQGSASPSVPGPPGPPPGPPPHDGAGPHGPGGPPPTFSELDANGDGVLSEEEVGEPHWRHMAEADSDGDGVVSKAEFDEHRNKQRPPPSGAE